MQSFISYLSDSIWKKKQKKKQKGLKVAKAD